MRSQSMPENEGCIHTGVGGSVKHQRGKEGILMGIAWSGVLGLSWVEEGIHAEKEVAGETGDWGRSITL